VGVVVFPDGSRVRASSISDRCIDDPERTYGLYADPRWEPTWPADVIAWPDFGLPEDSEVAAQQIVSAFDRARRGDLIEVGCLGGSGRTGTVLACMAVLAGVPTSEAVAWVRVVYSMSKITYVGPARVGDRDARDGNGEYECQPLTCTGGQLRRPDVSQSAGTATRRGCGRLVPRSPP
jgi:hypothetical protein